MSAPTKATRTGAPKSVNDPWTMAELKDLSLDVLTTIEGLHYIAKCMDEGSLDAGIGGFLEVVTKRLLDQATDLEQGLGHIRVIGEKGGA